MIALWDQPLIIMARGVEKKNMEQPVLAGEKRKRKKYNSMVKDIKQRVACMRKNGEKEGGKKE